MMVWPRVSAGQAEAFAQGFVDQLNTAPGVQEQNAFDHAVKKRLLAGLGPGASDFALPLLGHFGQIGA